MRDFVVCIKDIEDSGIGESPKFFPKKGKVYEVIDTEKREEFPDATFLILHEFDSYSWNADFFRPINNSFIEKMLEECKSNRFRSSEYRTKELDYV